MVEDGEKGSNVAVIRRGGRVIEKRDTRTGKVIESLKKKSFEP